MDGLTDEVVLRGYSRGDLDAMFHLDRACFDEPFRFSKASMRRFAEARDAQVLIAISDEELVGFSIVHLERSRDALVGYLVTLDVAAGHRRQGLALCLLTQAEHNAQQAGCSSMLLHVSVENAGAIALYEALGYDFDGTALDFYGSGLHARIYRKSLR